MVLYWLDRKVPILIFLLIKALMVLVDVILDFVFDYSFIKGSKYEREEAKHFEKSAQVVTVTTRPKSSVHSESSPWDFWYFHEIYEDPNIILSYDNIQLFMMTQTHVYFSYTDPHQNVYMSQKFPFTFILQYRSLTKMIILPISEFNHLADQVGDSLENVVFIPNTGRSGSVLLGQIMARVPETRVVSEPMALTNLCILYNTGKVSELDMKRILKSQIKLQLKKHNKNVYKRSVIKLSVLMTPLVPILKELFPSSKFIFNTRMPKQSISSFVKVYQFGGGFYGLTLKRMNKFFFECLPYPFDNKYLQEQRKSYYYFPRKYLRQTMVQVCSRFHAGTTKCYLEQKKIYSGFVLFEDLIKEKKNTVQKVFKWIDFPLDYVDISLEAMENHSQNEMFGKTGGRIDDNDSRWQSMDEVFKEVGIGISSESSLEELRSILE